MIPMRQREAWELAADEFEYGSQSEQDTRQLELQYRLFAFELTGRKMSRWQNWSPSERIATCGLELEHTICSKVCQLIPGMSFRKWERMQPEKKLDLLTLAIKQSKHPRNRPRINRYHKRRTKDESRRMAADYLKKLEAGEVVGMTDFIRKTKRSITVPGLLKTLRRHPDLHKSEK
jgi:hypothetical protein